MALIRIEQLQSNLSYDDNGGLTISGSLTIVNNPDYSVSASFNTSGSINVDIIDGGTY
jgi:hypothetical protein